MKSRALFEFEADLRYFERLLCSRGQTITAYRHLFDFASAKAKRTRFRAIRNRCLRTLVTAYGRKCQLQLSPQCTVDTSLTVDHLIPLSTNKLNKLLRGLSARLGGKVPSQSFGSNDIRNLIVACAKCNGAKKHQLLPRSILLRILETKYPPTFRWARTRRSAGN
jgi:5-methylcytosine-specific restriction endonuclease McrA